MKIRDIDPQAIREIFTYDPDTGELRWKINRARAKQGSLVGTANKNEKGRRHVRVMSVLTRVHILIWAYQTGDWPPEKYHLDHIDGDPSNNRWSNIRLATCSQNLMNMGKPITNKSGYKGVTLVRSTGKWMVTMRVNKKSKYFGCYEHIEEAAQVYKEKVHEFRGEFAKY